MRFAICFFCGVVPTLAWGQASAIGNTDVLRSCLDLHDHVEQAFSAALASQHSDAVDHLDGIGRESQFLRIAGGAEIKSKLFDYSSDHMTVLGFEAGLLTCGNQVDAICTIVEQNGEVAALLNEVEDACAADYQGTH